MKSVRIPVTLEKGFGSPVRVWVNPKPGAYSHMPPNATVMHKHQMLQPKAWQQKSQQRNSPQVFPGIKMVTVIAVVPGVAGCCLLAKVVQSVHISPWRV